MAPMTMRERILAVIQGRDHDRVPFAMYDSLLPIDGAMKAVAPHRIGLIRWCRVHTVVHPHCRFDTVEFHVADTKWQRITLHTPAGAIYEERAFEPTYDTGSIRKHFVQEPGDYCPLWAYLEDCFIVENLAQNDSDQAELGDDGVPMVAVERSPYQQLWVQWVGIDTLGFHLADCPDRVQHTVELLQQRARTLFDLAYRSQAPFVDFPDNITAPTIGPSRFQKYCVPLYNELADMLAERDALVFVHMDGDLKPLWQAIADSRVGGLDSFAPAPDNDTTVTEAATLWPEKKLFVNYPSSVHLRPLDQVRAETETILAGAGHTGRLQIQISENVPHHRWPVTLPVIAEAIEDFGAP